MNNSLRRIQAWRSRREQRSLERWEEIRAEGKARFVFRTSLTFGLTMVGATDFFDRIFDIDPHTITLGKVVYYVLAGIPIALIGWSNMEAKFQHALHEARVPALSGGEHPHNSNSLRITSDSKS